MTRRALAAAVARKTTSGGLAIALTLTLSLTFGCGRGASEVAHTEEEEALSRTEFTGRIENFFEHDPFVAGKPSQFLIHLTDLVDGTPVEKADVTLVARSKAGAEVAQIKARVGKVTGIYVADVALPTPGKYDIEFRVKNEKIDERMRLEDFEVIAQ